jgi:hypothetical protein
MQEKPNENKYQNGKIYKITDKNFTECYIGSTIQSLAVRFGGHKKDLKKHLQGKKSSMTSFALFKKYGVENCQILLVESFPCKNKEELNSREAFHIKNTPCVNKRIEGRTDKQRRIDKKEQYSLMNKRYVENNIDKVREYRKKYNKAHEAERKQYYNTNKEALLQKHREYVQRNKEALHAKRYEKKKCECGVMYTHDHRSRHVRTALHQRNLENKASLPVKGIEI